ncbi:hypothetical protein GCM10010440_33310 [Kitasatospora cinereorecta]
MPTITLMPRDESSAQRTAQLRLGRLPGYVRRPDPNRRGGEDGRAYKKGWEVRFTARTEQEIAEIRDLVVAAGFAPARPFFKGQQLIQPVYGIAAVQAYLAAREAVEALARNRRASAGGIPEQSRREATGQIPEQTRRQTPSGGREAVTEEVVAAATAAATSAAARAALGARDAHLAARKGAGATDC